ncbi:hypothetical protein LOD99_16063 [Oopsacas minuta]|uniref:threonine--tRNA ligase n=1 Tax=Oopsacas minuta TaxID=111878 RepID=A0AAV7K6Z9_9METZ|nr:hypothetical protein LOD99_16063 [Oopsacas minuta]
MSVTSSQNGGAQAPSEVSKADPQGANQTPQTLLPPPPDYIIPRDKFYARLRADNETFMKTKVPQKIVITLPDGAKIEGESWVTSPLSVAQGISQGLADHAVISRVDGVLWDLTRPLENDVDKLEILKFEDTKGQEVFWHSTAHVLGQAMELFYGGLLCYGPPIDDGFFYDMFMTGKQVSSNEFPKLEDIMNGICKQKQQFERLEVKKETLLELFGYNEFKCRIINEKVKTSSTTIYRNGPFIDLCRGPHITNTGKIKALSLTKNSSSYWEGKSEAESLQRIYGVSFPNSKLFKEWKHFQEEAAKRDHRKIGREQELFFFHDLSPGSCFFLPKGAIIYNRLIEFIKEEYWKRGYQEVITPNMYNAKLWKTSGHWEHYKDNLFLFEVEKENFALKPMNCPGHCLMFDLRPRSWRELPLRMADFGVLHRNEVSGSLTGLTRVRRFQQDDAHIFCTMDQVQDEITGVLDFLKTVYTVFGFSFQLKLSTRPDKYIGELSVWDRAEDELRGVLDQFGEPWEFNPGDGAFYGPKIDITLQDAIKRSHQCATIQLDFQGPERFNLTYVSGANEHKRPVMIHRAILGSVERMMAVLTENFAGKWPFWLSPRQVMIIPVVPNYNDKAIEVEGAIRSAGFMVESDIGDDKMNKKIRDAQLSQFNYILVVGEKELTNNTVSVRMRDRQDFKTYNLPNLLEHFRNLSLSRSGQDDGPVV